MHKAPTVFSLLPRISRYSLTLTAILSLFACSGGNKPSDAEIQAALAAKAAEATSGEVEVISLTKLNGAYKKEEGVYEAEYQAEIAFKSPLKVDSNAEGRGFEKFQSASGNTQEAGTAGPGPMSTSYFAPGYQTKIRGVAFLVKQDNGWEMPWNMITKIYWPDKPEEEQWQTF